MEPSNGGGPEPTRWLVALLVALPGLTASSCEQRTAHATAATAPSAPSAAAPAKTQPNAAPLALELKVGAPAPDVTLTLQDGFQLLLSSLKGKLIVVYFCSSEATPDCVREADGLRDNWHELHGKSELVVIGVSAQASLAQRAFIAEHRLPYDLASDPDQHVARAFMLPKRDEYGPYAFLIGRDGSIRASWLTADPALRLDSSLPL